MGRRLKVLIPPTLKVLRGFGRLAGLAPTAPWATGGYGLACQGALIFLFLVGLVMSIWLPGGGLVVMIVAALALLQFFLLQYRGSLLRRSTMIWLLGVAVSLGVVIAFVWTRWADESATTGGTSGDVMVLVATVASLVVLPLIRLLFREIFGPHHPESSLPEPEGLEPLWFWVGGVGATDATIVARVADHVAADEVRVQYRADGVALWTDPVALDEHRLARIGLPDLQPNTHYALKVEAGTADGNGTGPVASVLGSFTTFPPPLSPATFSMVFASCMSTGSRGSVFDAIRATEPKVFVVTGDLHYENINANRKERFLDAFDKVHTSHPQRRLYNSTPMAYVWDDHDFGDNDSGHNSPSRPAAQAAYRLAVPSYVEGGEAVNQEFSIGRVRVVMTDNRSERGKTAGHLLSPPQEQWLIERLTDPAWPVVVWVSTTPWISSEKGSDNWGAYPEQRIRIANAIGTRSSSIVMVSGDAHMLAIDDGGNSAYDDGKVAGFPVLQAAALDRKGGTKGGDFSHGKFSGAGQFGVVTVNDDGGDQVIVELSGRNWTGAEIVGHSVTIDAPAVITPPEDDAASTILMEEYS